MVGWVIFDKFLALGEKKEELEKALNLFPPQAVEGLLKREGEKKGEGQ